MYYKKCFGIVVWKDLGYTDFIWQGLIRFECKCVQSRTRGISRKGRKMKNKGFKKKWLSYLVAFLVVVIYALTTGNTEPETERNTQIAVEQESEQAQEQIGQEEMDSAEETETEADTEVKFLPEDGTYTTKEDVALYIHQYAKLPSNFITKKEAEKLGWPGGDLEPYAPGKCIGGDRFGNYEELLPEKDGRTYKECDIDTLGAAKRGAKRIVFSNDGLVFYTEDHYETFELLYGEE